MPILTLSGVSLEYGHQPLLDRVSMRISAGDRVCLVGRNGAGKSTLFRVISGTTEPDSGEVWRKDSLRISHLQQEVPTPEDTTVYETVAAGFHEPEKLLSEFHRATASSGSDSHSLSTLSGLQGRIDAHDGWNTEQKILSVCSRLRLTADKRMQSCSGGEKRRAMLARALVGSPDMLLLDEPTNHMDIDTITWLEGFLSSYQGTLLFITHDRTLLQNLANRIIQLDRGKLSTFEGDYDSYLRKQETLQELESRMHAKQDKSLAEHEAWIRKGVRARRARNEGRVRKLKAMRREKAKRLQVQGQVKMSLDRGDTSGKVIVELQAVSFSYDRDFVVRDLTTSVLRGDRVGIMGPNGSGKTTLLKLMLGELQPQEGRVVSGTRLSKAYFDQQRSHLQPEKTVRENVGDGSDFVQVGGRSRHVVGYLRDFLFPVERMDAPVKVLSGGERNRLLLARLFTRPANLLVLDEPTNDLDVDTLELLEDLLIDYEGTLLVVSHDRKFLDNVVSSTLVFEGEGRVTDYVGGYEDWLRQRGEPAATRPAMGRRKSDRSSESGDKTQNRKLGYREKRELETLPDRIEALEQEQQTLQRQIMQQDFYKQDKPAIAATMARVNRLREELDQAYKRWEQLDSLA